MTRHKTLIIGLVCSACGGNAPKSNLRHDIGRTLNDPSPYQWAQVSDEQYANIQMPFLSHEKQVKSLLPTTDAATQRVQFWIDKIDLMLRTRGHEDLALVPRPVGKVIVSNEQNAFVAPVPVCLGYTAKFDGLSTKNPGTDAAGSGVDQAVVFVRNSGLFAPNKAGCVASGLSPDKQVEQLQWSLKPYPNCSFKVEGTTVNFGAECLSGTPQYLRDKIQNGSRLRVLAVSNQVTFYSGLFSLFSEDEIVTLIAHELGHYYMSHDTSPDKLYDHFYQITNSNPLSKPATDEEKDKDGLEVLKAYKQAPDLLYYNNPAHKLHSVFYPFFARNFEQLSQNQCAGETPCAKSCAKLSTYMLSADGMNLRHLPYVITDAGDQSYVAFEDLALQCAAETKVSQDVMLFPNESHIKDSIKGFDDVSSLFSSVPKGDTLADILLAMTTIVDQAMAEKFAKLDAAAMKTQKLGYFTAEQEADELSLEWVNLIGVDPNNFVTAMVKSAEAFGKFIIPKAEKFGELQGSRCEALYKAGWLDQDGKPVAMPVGNWRDTHHSSCYRAYNAAQEIKNLSPGNFKSIPKPVAPGADWEAIKADLEVYQKAKDENEKTDHPGKSPAASVLFAPKFVL